MTKIIIDHVITIYWNHKGSARYEHTKKVFKYYRDLRNLLINYGIVLNFTIVGSNKEDSLDLFKIYFCFKTPNIWGFCSL